MIRAYILAFILAVCGVAHPQVVSRLLHADSLSAAGRHAEALMAYAEVTAALDTMDDYVLRSVRLRALSGMALCHRLTGDYRAALADYRTMEAAGLLDDRGRLNMSNLYLMLGLYTDVVDLLEPMHTRVGQATRKLNLASAYAYLNRSDDALRLLFEARADNMSQADRITLAANRGFIQMSLGRHIEAARSLSGAVAMMADGADRYVVMANLALAESGCGQYASALEHIDSCLAWQEVYIGRRHPDYAISVRKRAEILLAAGRRVEAATAFNRYFMLTRDDVSRSFAFLTAKQRQDYWYSRQPLVAECYAVGGENPGMAYDVALFSKSILLQAEADIGRAARRDTVTSRLYDDMSLLRSQASMAGIGPQRRDSLYAAADRCERRLMETLSEYTAFRTAMDGVWQDISARIGRQEAAVEFVRYGNGSGRRYAAVCLRGGGKPVFVPLWTEDSLLAYRMADGRSLGRALNSVYAADKDAIYSDSLLTAFVMAPIAEATAGCKRVYFAPDGVLHMLAVENMAGNPCGGAVMCRLTSTRKLLSRGVGRGRGALLFGGLSYDDCQSAVGYGGGKADRTAAELLTELQLPPAARGGYRYLPSTGVEVDSISALLSRIGGNDRCAVMKGVEGTETAFKRMAVGRGVIHVATHGFCFAHAGGPEPLAYCRDSLREDETMRRSGLVFAGANRLVRPAYATYDDGLLLASELSGLNLSAARLVVLSACQTGLGPVTADGVFGLQRGLKKAGVGAVVVSLWNVDDRATRLLMTRLYERLAGGESPNRALAGARDDVRRYAIDVEVETADDDTSKPQVRHLGRWVWPKKKVIRAVRPYSSPRYWAAFVMVDGV